MAYRKEMVNKTTFDEKVNSCEEKSFLKGYTIPMVQLDPFRTVLAVAHDTNTVDKKDMIKDEYKKKTKATKCVDGVDKYFLM